ncbi:MAG: hypothetical protein HY052_03960 [Proteobacteria bacterium]|nr:hypothetical protein [Pseudomonadota bacterium]
MTIDFQTTLIPLATLILLGWLVGRTQDIDLKSVTTILIYAISPVVAFLSTAQMHFKDIFVFLPGVTLILSATCDLSTFVIGRYCLKKKELGYLLPIAAGSGNNGYFGLPLAMAVFAPERVGIYFLVTLGVTFFEATLGYFFVARGHLSAAEALQRAIRIPVTYAIVAGLILSSLHLNLDPGLLKLYDAARGCYVSLGMMIIGMALAKHKRLAWDMDFLALSMFGKYGLWALFTTAFIWADTHLLKAYDADIHKMI